MKSQKKMILASPDAFQPSCRIPDKLDDQALWFIFRGKEMYAIKTGDKIEVPYTIDPSNLGITLLRKQYLGTINEIPCFSAEAKEYEPTALHLDLFGLRALFGRLDDELFSLAGRAFQIMDWDRTHQYCGSCGEETMLQPGERTRKCPKCSARHYPRIAPAVMALVKRNKEFLLARSPHFPPGMYSALAGFSEPGETLEQTVEREVEEEVGLKVKNIRYFASQPWPFPNSMMIAFHCEYSSGELIIDEEEIEAAQWFNVTNLPPVLPGFISIARRLVDSALEEV